jgi:signal peptidase I
MRALITTSRRALTAVWVVMLVSLIGLAAWSHLASLIVIAGSSMEPALPRGALIGPAAVDPASIAAGDILTVRADNNVIVTHRVARVVDLPEGRFFELKGDANPSNDPQLVPERAVIGRVDLQVPYAGYVLALLSIPVGLVFLLTALGGMLVGIWLLDDLEAGISTSVRRRGSSRAVDGASA